MRILLVPLLVRRHMPCSLQVRGHPTGNGSPAWLSTHPEPAAESAAAVQALLDAGARVVGKVCAHSGDGRGRQWSVETGEPPHVAVPDERSQRRRSLP
jgi:hypothetical protein